MKSPAPEAVSRVPSRRAEAGTTAAALTGCAYLLSAPGKPATARASATRPAAVARRPGVPAAGAGLRLGVFEPGEGFSCRPVERFAAAVGRQPDIVLTYSAWLEPFETEFARTLHDHGAEPLIQIEPGDASLTAITGGRYDATCARTRPRSGNSGTRSS